MLAVVILVSAMDFSIGGTAPFSIGGTNSTKDHPSELAQQIPGVMNMVMSPCDNSLPGCKDSGWFGGTICIRDIIIHMNDGHKWTREQIADWLETLDEIPGW